MRIQVGKNYLQHPEIKTQNKKLMNHNEVHWYEVNILFLTSSQDMKSCGKDLLTDHLEPVGEPEGPPRYF